MADCWPQTVPEAGAAAIKIQQPQRASPHSNASIGQAELYGTSARTEFRHDQDTGAGRGYCAQDPMPDVQVWREDERNDTDG